GDGGDILVDSTVLDSTATAPNTVTTARMAMEIPATTARMPMEIPATVMGMATDTATAPNTVTMARMAMAIAATVIGMATDLATAMQANTAPPLDRGDPNYNSDSLAPGIIAGQSMEPSGPRRNKQFAPIWRTTVTQAHPLPPIKPTATDLAKQ